MATLHFIGGKAGAGKTSLARELGRTLPAIVICEDEWIHNLGFQVRSLEEYLDVSNRCRKVWAPLAVDLLRLGVSVVLDYAGNTPERRARIRSLFESAGADHVLHWIEASDAACVANVRRRNHDKPAGVYWGDVDDELVNRVNQLVSAPSPEEGFTVVHHPAHAG